MPVQGYRSLGRGIDGAVGETPMVELQRLPPPGSARVLVKLEYLNPSGSIKDRAALAAIQDAEERGDLRAGGAIVEATSGNMGLALALVGAARGHKVIIVMPEELSQQPARRLALVGAEVVRSQPAGNMAEAGNAARRLADENQGYWFVDQFNNPSVVRAHRENTGPEILRDAGRTLDAFVAGVGIGGTLTGVGQALKAASDATSIVAVEPARSPVISGGTPAAHHIVGIGAGFVPPLLDSTLIDRTILVEDDEAFATAQELAKIEGLFVGPSSGANVSAALRIAAELGEGRTVVTVLADSGERHLGEFR